MHEESTGLPFQKSTDEVRYQILQLSDVWERYCSLVAQTSGDISQSCISRRTTFKEYLQNRLSDEYQFLRPLHRSIFEREALLIQHQTVEVFDI
jgi:hypothetical protein